MHKTAINFRYIWESIPLIFFVWIVRVAGTFAILLCIVGAGLAEKAGSSLLLGGLGIFILMWMAFVLEGVER